MVAGISVPASPSGACEAERATGILREGTRTPDHRGTAVRSSRLPGMVSASPCCDRDLRFHNRVLCLDEQGYSVRQLVLPEGRSLNERRYLFSARVAND
jgi:hypothetical protein